MVGFVGGLLSECAGIQFQTLSFGFWFQLGLIGSTLGVGVWV